MKLSPAARRGLIIGSRPPLPVQVTRFILPHGAPALRFHTGSTPIHANSAVPPGGGEVPVPAVSEVGPTRHLSGWPLGGGFAGAVAAGHGHGRTILLSRLVVGPGRRGASDPNLGACLRAERVHLVLVLLSSASKPMNSKVFASQVS